jgi:diguanylate cyclase (GGDEF)-like protein
MLPTIQRKRMPMFKKTDKKNQDKKDQVNMRDSLTGLKNRNYFHYTYGELGPVKDAAHKTMAAFDIDHFKAANDLIDGDKAIKDIVAIMNEIMDQGDELMRWGGDEFLVVLRSDLDESYNKMKKFAERVAGETPVTVSVGLIKIRHEDTFKTNYYRAVK